MGKKGTFGYALRAMTESDIPALVDYTNECAALEKVLDSTTLEEYKQWHTSPSNYDRETLAFLTNDDGSEGRIVGQMNVGINPADTRAWGWMHVHPDYRNNGVGRALYARFVQQAEEANVSQMTIRQTARLPC